jgi:hypothetical protein
MAREQSSEDPGFDRQSRPSGLDGGGQISSSFEAAALLHRTMALPGNFIAIAARSLSNALIIQKE